MHHSMHPRFFIGHINLRPLLPITPAAAAAAAHSQLMHTHFVCHTKRSTRLIKAFIRVPGAVQHMGLSRLRSHFRSPMDARRYEVADAIDVITSGPSTRYGNYKFPIRSQNLAGTFGATLYKGILLEIKQINSETVQEEDAAQTHTIRELASSFWHYYTALKFSPCYINIRSIPRDVLEYGNPPYFEKRRRLTVITVLHTHNKLQVITASIINVCNKVPCGFETRLISYCCAELTRLIRIKDKEKERKRERKRENVTTYFVVCDNYSVNALFWHAKLVSICHIPKRFIALGSTVALIVD
ncbi:hypothetical protein EAG_15953 [Camponotus floridanus]|uniref:Uncharacterized protein n=1 Tax=Camponotus floridanus TaxID=104421 RepID=E1ZW10_CAMFO|nr:hypothetical protein EAG_15953 [Camponotus floridanus]